MTIIAYKDGKMAADSMLGDAGTYLADVDKFIEHGDWWIGCCGHYNMLQRLRQLCAKHADTDLLTIIFDNKDDFPADEFDAIAVNGRTRVVKLYSGKGQWLDCAWAGAAAAGAGRLEARAAMHAGASAETAVEIVIRMLPGSCGGPVRIKYFVPESPAPAKQPEPKKDLTFAEVLAGVKHGKRYARRAWPVGSKYYWRDDGMLHACVHLGLSAPDLKYAPQTMRCEDLVAEDWYEVAP